MKEESYICYMKIVKLVLIYMATAILMVHTLVPHEHSLHNSDSITLQDSDKEDKIWNFVEMLVQSDAGSHHLENLVKSDVNVDCDGTLSIIPLSAPAIPSFNLFITCDAKDYYHSTLDFREEHHLPSKDIYLSNLYFRGPPQFA